MWIQDVMEQLLTSLLTYKYNTMPLDVDRNRNSEVQLIKTVTI